MFKKQNIFKLLLLGVTLFSCSNTSSVSSNPSSNESTVSVSNESTSSQKPSVNPNCVLDKKFEGYKVDAMPFFNEGWMTGGSIFDEDYIKLKRKDGFVRSNKFENDSEKLEIILTARISGLPIITDLALNKVMKFSVQGLNDNGEVVSKSSYFHQVSQEDIDNKTFKDFPTYDNEFKNNEVHYILNGKGISKVSVVLEEKIIYGKDGVNLDIQRIQVIKTK